MGVFFRISWPVQLNSGESALFGCIYDGPTKTISDAVTAANNIAAAWNGSTAMKTHFPSGANWGPAIVQTIDDVTYKVVQTSFGSTIFNPSGGAAPLPPQIAVCVTIRTALSGPAHRGRFYLPSPNAAALGTVGRLTPTACADILAGMAAGFAAAKAAGFNLQVLSKVGHNSNDAVAIEVGDVTDTQTRRRDSLTEVRVGALI